MVSTLRPPWVADVVCRLWGEQGSVFDLSSQLRELLSSIKPQTDELLILAQEFFLTATMSSHPDQRMLECLKMLSHAELISWVDLLGIITGFTQYQKSYCVVAICGLLESEIPHLQNVSNRCSFSHVSDCLAMTKAVIDVFIWIVEGMQRRSGIRSLTAVFSCFRVLAPVDEVADTMLLFGQINAISHHDIVSDMLHASFMILLEEQETRDNSKSSIEMFFYVKMPRVWSAMIKLGMKPDSVVKGLAYLTRDDVQRQAQVAVVLSAIQARHVIDKLWNMQEKLMTVLTRLIGSGGYAFDAFCSSYGLEGTLGDMSSKLASLNLLSESPSNVCVDRNMTFDLTFTMLTRIVYKYSNLTLDELVKDPRGGPDNTACSFYQWSSRYVKRISSHPQEVSENESLFIPPEVKAAYKERVLRLKERQLFWDPVKCNYGQLLHDMPIVGEVILDFFKDRKHIEEDISPPSEARRQMARCIKMVLEESVPDEKDEKDRWLFTRMVCRRQLDEMCECDSVIPPMTITLMAIAKRLFPPLHRRQIPDKEMLKKAWLYAQRQNWASPNVLRLIDHCNRAGAHKAWFEFYMHHMMKLRCPDVMDRAIETICACLLLEPQETLITACVLMVDFMMDKKSQVQFEVPYVIPLVKLLTQVMLMSVWIIDRECKKVEELKNSEPKTKRPKLLGDVQIHPSIKILQETVEVAINKFVKGSSQGYLCQPISSVCHIVRMIAGAPESEAKQLLIPYLKHLLFFQLARLEPGSISFELFSTFCDPRNEDHDLEKLKFLCLLRKSGGI
ncbi:hypothetical protein DICVIV_08715 [Dictyocaulus viviparus]|uniref:Uncharacterized protein n=1 Tax=Dictyocaulus viviparus TaxID=29172 RepID=A0A0D8XL32_DICVI|nr:hypothetical protein DICVIV_08715 [Dictyocaulus viviparus]